MGRYRRVNIDGDSLYKSETGLLLSTMRPGTFVILDGNRFKQAMSASGFGLYVLEAAHHEGLGIEDSIPGDHTGVAYYAEEGREFAVLAVAGSYKKDQPITVDLKGLASPIPIKSGTHAAVGFSQDTVTLKGPDCIRVRIRAMQVASS